ncbi:hypothetical protein CY35_01G055800 [Sphagnum magellanicum]|nr:hypothetical protein CY35_01G055800 [Sphagnum magellanicum]KAH9574413.1 hypothetical protein CY35_01G055800 [Sphagnum magellanicum]KAH9574414.1 hypothetical protein CY35_01G055800 [Sphagnum magellanicum]
MEEMMEYEYYAHINKQQQHQQKEQQQTQLSVSDVHQRRRPKKKPLSIHDAAQAGDVKSLQSKLEEDTGLINSRNPIMTETPLHRAAASNEVDAVKFLLEWQGAEKVELETKNTYGETPLHLAAKNGCTEAMKLLLQHGAYIEARANNGMTPLHLAVWYSVRADTVAPVEALLEYDANVSAKDNEAQTPLSHLPKSPSNDKLRNLLQVQLDKQQSNEGHSIIAALEAALQPIVGLEHLKLQLRRWAKGTLLNEKRRALGLHVPKRQPPHMCFLGNPGTGKTMVARILARLLHSMGVLTTDKVVEVQRTDLVGEFVGHTGPRTRTKIQEAEGGILFVDEAYRLMPVQSGTDKDYGVEALEEIMSVMDSGKLVVIFAGYTEPMQRLFGANQGFQRRVTRFFHFDDFSTKEIAQIVYMKLAEQTESSLIYGFKLADTCSEDALAKLLENLTTEKQRQQLNGGLVWPLLVNAREHLDERLDLDCCDPNDLVTITMQDLEAGLQLLPP